MALEIAARRVEFLTNCSSPASPPCQAPAITTNSSKTFMQAGSFAHSLTNALPMRLSWPVCTASIASSGVIDFAVGPFTITSEGR